MGRRFWGVVVEDRVEGVNCSVVDWRFTCWYLFRDMAFGCGDNIAKTIGFLRRRCIWWIFPACRYLLPVELSRMDFVGLLVSPAFLFWTRCLCRFYVEL
jgi:hypothetical protein